jgi:Domain of unknown function (DUF1929)/Bacterial Ig-like domain/Glyoxal oxidase N-terminus
MKHAILITALAIALGTPARVQAQALSIDATKFGDRSTAATTIAATAVTTTAGNELLLAFVSTDNISGTTTVTGVAGGGLTWQLAVRTNAQRGTAEVWRTFAPAVLTNVTVTATLSQSVAGSIVVVSFKGADPSGASGAGALGATRSASASTGAPTGTLTTTRAGSWVFGVGNDWDHATARTLGSNQTLVHQYLATIGDTYWVQRMTNPTASAGTSVTINDTAPTADRYDLSLVEILPASSTPDTTPPTVTTVTPAGGATNVAPTTTATATFSEALNAATITTATVRLQGPGTTAVPAAVAYNAATRVATLTPSATLTTGTLYTATVTGGAGGVTDVAGNPLAGNFVWTFTTVPADTTPPTVTAVTPVSGATNVASTTTVTATFSEALNAATVTPTTVTLQGPGTTAVPATVAYTAATRVATLAPGATLTAGTLYTATVTGVTDVAGNALAGSVVWTFTTVPADTTPPTVTTVTPVSGATNVAATTAVTATFSEALNAATVTAATVTLQGPGTTAVPATVAYNTTTRIATLTPAAALTAGTQYTATVIGGAGGVTDLASNALAGSVVWTFTTVLPDTTPPIVSAVTPVSGATNVSATTTVTATFNEALTAATVTGATVTLQGPGTTAVPASVGYNASTRVATLTPTAALAAGTLYTATVIGGAGGVADAAGNALASNVVWTFTTATNNFSVVGQWNPVISWPLVAINATLLQTGEVLVWDGGQSVGSNPVHGGQSARLWNPATQAFTSVPESATDLFCSASCALPDGRIFVAGGGDPSNDNIGVPDANIFSPITRSWSAAAKMAQRRWYPTATCLPDGRVLITSGSQLNDFDWVTVPEVYTPATNSWTKLSGAQAGIPYYPHVFVLPDGRVLDASSFEQAMSSDVLDLSTQMRVPVSSQVLDAGSAAMYLPGKIVKTGTAAFNNGASGPAAATTYVLDMTQTAPSWRKTASMNFPRSYHTLTLLPDGTVIVTGGGKTESSTDVSKAVFNAEIWSPVTELWTAGSAMQTPRLYHSIGLLLPDGRVLVAGGGRNFNDSAAYKSAEIYSPPYLFKGARPTITSPVGNVSYGGSLAVQTPDGASIASVVLVRNGSVTHGINMDQRLVPLSFQQSSDGLTVTAPANANLAPPGYYLLFIVNAAGVPSVAPIIHVGP